MRRLAIITCVLILQQRPWVHAAPPTEPCPHDSIQVADTCKCDPKRCSKPPCPFKLNILTNGTDTPGKCCTIYSCDGCKNETLLNGKCPCAPGAILNSKGECECVDKHKNLINNECVCNSDLCELPQICGTNYVAVTEQNECCTETKCIKCPDDSFATNNNDEAVEDKCVCYPCKEKECAPNETVVIIQPGKDFPGSCCDMYKCEKDETKCNVSGVFYHDGSEWTTPDGHTCKCRGGISFCNEDENFQNCHDENIVYKHNESWMLDSCTNCTCVNGEKKCIALWCEVAPELQNKPECQPLNCSKTCPDGYKLNKRGCKICKCNYPYRYDDILQKYNITKNQLKDIVDEYFANGKKLADSVTTTTTAPTTTVLTNVSDEDYQFTAPFIVSDGCQLWARAMWIMIGLAIALILAFLIHFVRRINQRKKGSYDTNPNKSTIYEKMPNSVFNNNYIGNENKDESNCFV